MEHLRFSISPTEKDLKMKLCEHITCPGLVLLVNTKVTPLNSFSAETAVRTGRPLGTWERDQWDCTAIE